MKNNYFLALFFCVFITSNVMHSQTTHYISDPEDITALSATLGAGDTVILADNDYSTDARIKFSPTAGTSAMPITFRAATPGGVKFTNNLQMSIGGDHVIVDGFHWLGGYGASKVIEFRDGTDYANNSTIQNCVMDGLTVHSDDIEAGTSVKHNWIQLYGTYNTVINCSFMNKTNAGNIILVDLYYNNIDDPCAIVGHTISNNYFYNYEKIDTSLTNAGDSETIRIGTSSDQNVYSNCTVSNNYFVSADGENEIISNKSKNNIYTNNTFRKSRGSLVLRHGSNATVDGNYFLGEGVDGTGGIRIVDSDHTITNNYIQDCITIVDQAKWNNGITFLGGNDNNAVACTSTSTSSGYQQVENINLSNNTIINTNAPLFYNTDKGSTDPTGTVNNNLIYFTTDYPAIDLTPVISGDTATSYANLGTTLAYSGNVYTGTSLGETNAGFSEEIGITATANGEIFTFSGAGSAGKGADMGAYIPTTDAMVGYGIGACFLNNFGVNITDGDCTIVVPESLTVSSLSTLTSDAASYDVTVSANVSWTAESNDTWITINPELGDGDATVSVMVTQNTDVSDRTGTVTFTQDPGGDDIIRVLNVTQEGIDLTDLYNLINIGTGLPTDQVQVIEFSQEEVNGVDKFNYAKNTLDKDTSSRWAAKDVEGDGEYVIYDLDDLYELDLIQIATDDKSDPYGLQVWVSTTGTDPSDFTMVLPTAGNLLITTTVGTYDDYDQYEVDVTARYVKLMGYGRFNSAGAITSQWSNITEIEFYGDSVLSVDEFEKDGILLYPNPVSDNLNIKVNDNSNIDSYELYTLDGRLLIEEKLETSSSIFTLNLSNLASGTYVISLSSIDGKKISKKIIVSK